MLPPPPEFLPDADFPERRGSLDRERDRRRPEPVERDREREHRGDRERRERPVSDFLVGRSSSGSSSFAAVFLLFVTAVAEVAAAAGRDVNPVDR